MTPISRGSGPVEYTLRVYCEQGPQFAFEEQSAAVPFNVAGVGCLAQTLDDHLIFSATGFANVWDATQFFFQLQSQVARACVQDRIAISLPAKAEEAQASPFVLPEGESTAKKQDWPKSSIPVKLIYSIGAWIYPEHEFVLLSPIYSFKPTFKTPLQALVTRLDGAPAVSIHSKVDPLLLQASAYYAQAVRSTQWVWSFLLTVMTLEMLSARGPRKQALITLVQQYCAPTTAANPLPSVFVDVADCKRKVSAIYDLRSHYTHEGQVPSAKAGMPPFHEARETALAALAHIILERLAGR